MFIEFLVNGRAGLLADRQMGYNLQVDIQSDPKKGPRFFFHSFKDYSFNFKMPISLPKFSLILCVVKNLISINQSF